MAKTSSESSVFGLVPIHFDTTDHYLPLDTFIETAQQTRAVIENLNRQFFSDGVTYRVVVLPPEEGSFLAKLGITIVAGFGLVFTFVESDIGKAYIEGLTGHEPSYFFKKAGQRHQDILHDLREQQPSPKAQAASNELLAASTKGFLEADPEALRRVGFTPPEFYDAIEAKNRFYQKIESTDDVRAIGFKEEPDFPINRADFSRLQTLLGPREEPVEKTLWTVETVDFVVTSPNWDRSDRQRPWKGVDANNKEKYFRIEDDNFWTLVNAKRIKPAIFDRAKVQWAIKDNHKRSGIVLRVLEYNGNRIGESLSDAELAARLEGYDVEQKAFGTSLLDFM